MLPRPQRVFAFTQSYPGIANVLISDIGLSEAYDPKSGLPAPVSRQYKGLWDTGASGSVINSRIISELGLKPSGQTIVQAVGDGGRVNEYVTDTFSINVVLPNRVAVIGVVAAKGEISGADMLIGMNVIGSGDFAVTNASGKTMVSFRIPSFQEIDFVREIDEYNRLHAKVTSPHYKQHRSQGKGNKHHGKHGKH